ncbi:MAG TPA: transketolase [Polyangiaceae bacterium]|nr:transketolase [Polyangiaceae bacterium]
MDEFEKAVHTIQFLSADAVEKAASGHPGTPMALAGITVDIYTRYLRYDPRAPEWPNRDRFVLSCGHASMLLYSVLHLAGYDLPLSELEAFRQWGSKTPGHPEHGLTPGVETTTGPLGQGVGNAVGMALASKLAAARVNAEGSEVFNYRVFALASDGDLMEGVSGEASSIAGHLGLDNLVLVYDDNKITIDGSTELSFSEDVGKRYEAYGWFVQRVNGHVPDEVRKALDAAVAHKGSPSLIVARTIIGIGAPTKAGTSKAHGAPLGQGEIDAAKKAAGWPLEKFHVAPEAKSLFARRAEENRAVRETWERLVSGLSGERADAYQKLTTRAVPKNLLDELVTAAAAMKPDATRILGAAIEQKAAALVPALVGGAADLAESTKTTIKGSPDVKRGEFGGRNMNFGIREHGMAAVMNGLAVSGLFIPFGSSFLQFTDYCRPSIRLSALMEQQVVYVFTHDSIFLGEDGPTHQPIEHLWALRLIPHLDVIRPADALECAAAWAHALERRHGPSLLVLCRQKVPALERPAGFNPRTVLDGAYVLSDAPNPEVTIIATGSEVGVAVGAKKLLEQKGKRVRVVSAPCWDAFERLSPEARAKVVPDTGLLVTVEAGVTHGWAAVTGPKGLNIGIDRFGASAPYERLATEFGFTGESVAAKVLERLA